MGWFQTFSSRNALVFGASLSLPGVVLNASGGLCADRGGRHLCPDRLEHRLRSLVTYEVPRNLLEMKISNSHFLGDKLFSR